MYVSGKNEYPEGENADDVSERKRGKLNKNFSDLGGR